MIVVGPAFRLTLFGAFLLFVCRFSNGDAVPSVVAVTPAIRSLEALPSWRLFLKYKKSRNLMSNEKNDDDLAFFTYD